MAQPIGRYVVGESFVYWCSDARLYGAMLWGRPGEAAVRQLTRLFHVEIAAGAKTHASLVDFSGVTEVEPAGFALMREYLVGERAALGRVLTRQALVCPAGVVGATVAGFYRLWPPLYPVEIFDGAGAALAWLGRGDEPALAVTLAELRRPAAREEPLLDRLRPLLRANEGARSVPSAARALGLSPRTLQRRLHEAGTTFQAELNRAQVTAAQRLLLDTDAKVTAIALEVGCASPQHFSVLFRRHTGLTPSEWRERHRAPR